MRFFWLCLIVVLIHSAKITDQARRGVTAFRNNLGEGTSITFSALIPTSISQSAELIIEFPDDYTQIALSSSPYRTYKFIKLRIPCPVSITSIFGNSCPVFTTSNSILTITMPNGILSGEYDIRVERSINPTSVTSNSNRFRIRTVSQGKVIDQNEYFSEFAFTDTVASISDTVELLGSNFIGTNSTLRFSFQTNISGDFWFRVRIPDQFEAFPSVSPVCKLNQTTLSFNVDSQDNYRWIILPLQNFISGAVNIFDASLILPGFSIASTDQFLFEIMTNNTNSIINSYIFSGITVQIGNLEGVTFTTDTLNTLRIANYSISFNLQHQIIDGMITMTLPDIQYKLSKNCTSTYTRSVCYSQTQTMVIPAVTLYAGQAITVQFLVLNPADFSKNYSLEVATFTTFNNTLFEVDQATINIQLSQVGTPIFEAFEMYRPIVNATLNQQTSIDFRYVPQIGNELPLTSATNQNTVYFQIPLWFRVQTQDWNDLHNSFDAFVPNCTFGSQGSYSCSYALQVFLIKTPIAQLQPRYPSGLGLGQCDKTISVKDVLMPPIPGRYDFRVMTFKNKTALVEPPTEQDMFTMQIPVDPFAALSIISSSKQANDIRNILKISFTTGISVPYEGTINLNFSLTQTSTQSAWPNQLGHTFTTGINYVRINCGMYIGGSLQTTPQCYLFDMSSKGFNIIQVGNFGTLKSGDTVVLYLMDVKYCVTTGKKCAIDFNTAYTVSLDNPYYLNKQTVQVSSIIAPQTAYQSISNDPTILFSASSSLCTQSTWAFTLTPSSLPQPGDMILVSLPSQKIYLSVNSISSPNGTVGIIIDSPNNTLYIVITLTTAASSESLQLNLDHMTNPFEDGTQLSPILYFWSSQLKSAVYTIPSKTFSGNGILNVAVGLLPSTLNNLIKTFSDTDLGSEVILTLGFTVCKPVPATGVLLVDPNDGINYASTCTVYSGLTGTPQGLGDSISCQWNNGKYIISGFQQTSPMTNIDLTIKISINTSYNLTSLVLGSFSDASMTTLIDSNLNAIGTIYKFGQTGFTYPSLFSFDPFVQTSKSAVMNQRGEFHFKVTPKFSHSFPETITFNFTTAIKTTSDGRLHCRVNGVLADLCVFTDYAIVFTLPQGFTIAAGTTQTYLFTISTRGRDSSLTGDEGLTLQTSGIYTMFAFAGVNGASNYEYTYMALEVLPQTFWNFWVYSINKNVNTRLYTESGRTYYQINFGCNIPNDSKLIVNFYRTNAGTDGFQKDLGTGISNGGDFPCYLNFGNSNTVCTLYYGVYPSSTQVEISVFGSLNGYYTIILPNMFNPNVSLSIVKVGLVATLTSTSGVTTKLYSSTYDLVNVTFGLPSPLIESVIYQNLTQKPSFTCTNVSTYCRMSIPISSGPLANTHYDNVVFEFPSDYPINDGYVESSFDFCINCSLCMSRSKIITMRIWWGLSANTLIWGSMNISTPLYRSLSGNSPVTIKTLLYKDFKLMKVTYMNMTQSFTEALLTPTVTVDTSNIGEYATYNLKIALPVSVRSSSVFLIHVPALLDASSAICQIQDQLGNLLLTNTYQCSIWNNNNSLLLAEGFGSIAQNSTINIVVKALNPATIVTVSSWTVQIFYKKQTLLDKLVAQGTAPSPSITNTTVTKTYWDKQFVAQTNLISGQRGILTFTIKQATGIQKITFPSGVIALPQNTQPLCLVTTNIFNQQSYQTSPLSRTVPLQCSFSSTQITVPQISPSLGSHTKLIITTLNDNRGITFVTPGTHTFTLTTFSGLTSVVDVVIVKSNFASFSTSTLVTNCREKTLIKVNFVPKTSATSFQIMFPLRDPYNKTRPIYSQDLGSGLANGFQASCFGRVGFANASLPCTLSTGTIVNGYTCIVINTPISSGTTYQFEIDSIMTPPIFGNDYTSVHHIIQSYNSSGATGSLLDRSIYYDYTVRNINYSSSSIASAPSPSTTGINDTGVSYTFNLKTFAATVGTGTDYLIIEFPQAYYKPIPQLINYNTSVNTWVSTGNNWVIHSLAAGLAANSNVNVRLLDCVNSYVVTTNNVFKVYHVQNNVIIGAWTMAPMAPFSVSASQTYVAPQVPQITTMCNINKVHPQAVMQGIGIQILAVAVTLSSVVNSSFSLTMSVPSTFFGISLAHSSPNSSAVYGSNSVVFNFPRSLSTTEVFLYFQGVQITNNVSLSLKLNNELGTELDTIGFDYSDSGQHFDVRTQIFSKRVQAMVGEFAQMKLTLGLQSALARGDYLEVDTAAWSGYFIPQSATRWDAFLNDMAAEKTFKNGSKIQVFSPILGVGNGVTITLTIRGVSMKMGNSNAQATIAHKNSADNIVRNYTNYLIPINSPLLSTSPSHYFVSTASGQPSIFKSTLSFVNTLTVNDTLQIYFNTHSNYLSSSLFSPNLGSFTNLKTIDCVSQILLTCVLRLGADYFQAPTIISLTPRATTNLMTLSIPMISIPTNTSTFLSVSMLLVKNGLNVSELVSEYVMYPTTVPLTTGSASSSITPNLVGEPATLSLTVGTSVGSSYDRFVLKYDSSLVLEMPFNPVSPFLLTAVSNGVIFLYPICKWMEIALSVSTTSSSLLQILNVKNVGWRQALSFVFVQMTSTAYRTATITLPAPSANTPISSYSATPSPVLISQTQNIAIILRPKNRIYAGGQIRIGLPNVGLTGSEFCSIIDGLVKAKCQVDWTALQMRIYGFKQYEPVLVDEFDYSNNIANPIKIQFQATMPSIAQGSLLFSITIYNDSSLSSINQQQSSISSGISIQAANILGLSLVSLNKAQQLIRGNSYGTISINLQFSTTLSFVTNDYLMFDFGDSIVSRYYDSETLSYYPQYNYIMCHFAIEGTLVQKVKTHRCEFVDWTVLTVYIPEEFNVTTTNKYKLTVESVLMNSSDIYWVKFTYMKNGVLGTERAWQKFTINPNNFNTRVAKVLTHQATSANNTLNVLNLTLKTSGAIPDSVGPDLSRIVLTFPTHNQQNKSFPMNLADGQTNDTELIGCNGAYSGVTRPLPASSLACYSIRASSDTWNNTPSYITMQGYSSIPASEQFNINIGWFVNPLTVGTFADMVLRIEKRTLTGDWVTLNENTVFNLIPTVLPAPNPITSEAAFTYSSWNYVSDSFGQFHLRFTPTFDLHRDDTLVLGFSQPYSVPRRTQCSQYSGGANFSEGCTSILKDNLFLLGNNQQITSGSEWHSLQWYSFYNPPYTYNETVAACPLYIYVFSQGKLVYRQLAMNITPLKKSAYVVMQPTTHDNPANSSQLYHVGFSLVSVTTYVTYIQLLAPDIFTSIDSCTVNKGLKRISPDSPIICEYTRNASGWSIQLYNFDKYRGDGLVILDIVMGNPPEGWTTTWRVSSYPFKGNYDNKITENYNAKGIIWVGASPQTPLHYYVYRNLQSFEDRKATINQWAQLWTRVIPRTSHTNSSFYLMEMPVSYDLPNSQQTECNVTYSGQNILESPNCTINANRSVSIYSQNTGIPYQQCQIISATSINAVDSRNGFLLPPNITGNEKFSISIFDTLSTESTQKVVSPKPYPLLPITVDSTVREVNYLSSIVRLKFRCNTPVPAGYYADIPIGYQGRIQVLFQTVYLRGDFHLIDGFNSKLGFATNTTSVPCKVFSGLTGTVACQVSFAVRSSIYDYAKVVISGFEALSNNTDIEIHLLGIRYVGHIQSPGTIGVSFYQIDQNNNRIDLSQPTYADNPATRTYDILQVPTLYQTATATLVPHFVGAQVNLSISYLPANVLRPGDMIQLTFPNEFNLQDSGPLTANSAGVPLTLVQYEMTNTILLIVQTSTGNIITINQVIDASLVFTYTVMIKMKVIQSSSVLHYVDVDVPQPNPAPFSVCLMSLSDYTQTKVAVNYTFSIMPSYTVQVNSSLIVTLPSEATGLNYTHLSTSVPKQICTSSIGICDVSPNQITIPLINTTLITGQLYSFVVSGVKNPNFAGVAPNNSFIVRIFTPNNYLELEGTIQAFRFYPLTGPNRLYMRVLADSYFKNVTSDYTVRIQTSTFTPLLSTLILDLPLDWSPQPLISSISGNWGLNTLLYTLTSSVNATHSSLFLNLRFSIPGKSLLTVQFASIVNPLISISSAFSARTIYDSQVIDAVSDYVALQFQDTPPLLELAGFGFTPLNELQTAEYTFKLLLSSDLPSDSQIMMYFQQGYLDDLVDDRPLIAILNGQQLQATASSRKLVLTTLRDVASGQSLNLSLYGILNPPQGTYYIDIALISNSTVTAYSNHQAQVSTTASSPNLQLSYMDLSDYSCSSFSDMKVCFDPMGFTGDGVEVWITLPQEFEQATLTDCDIAGTNVYCAVQAHLKRIIVKPASLTNGNLCLSVKGIKNTNSIGETHPFTLSLYSNITNTILATTYPNINSFSTMFFTKSKLTINVGAIADFSPDTCSLPITVTLERGSATQLRIMGVVDGFTLSPNEIVFAPAQTESTFFIIPTQESPYGLSFISWTKVDEGDRYGQLPQTRFKLIKKAPIQYQITMSAVLSQTPILQTSNNITLTIPISPSRPLNISLKYGKLPECIGFSSNPITFTFSGPRWLSFNYTSSSCAVSDAIQLTIETSYSSIYSLYSKQITVQLTQPDTTAPTIINHYVYDLARNYIQYRVMTSEPATVMYMLTLRGTSQPTLQEIQDWSLRKHANRQSHVIELYGSNKSVATLHATYAAYDTYLDLQELEAATNYVLYFTAIDLSGNPSPVQSASIKTLEEYFSAVLSLCLKSAIPISSIQSTLVQSTNWSSKYLQITQTSSASYTIWFIPHSGSPRPIEAVQNIDGDRVFISKELQLCDGFTFSQNSYENVSMANQWIDYGVSWVSDAELEVWAVAQQDGYVYASTGGNYPEQIQKGLTSDNFLLYNAWHNKVYANAGTNVTLRLSQLYDQSQYSIYLAAQNSATPTQLMSDSQVATVVTTTNVSTYSLPDSYVYCPRIMVPVLLATVALL